MKLVDIQRREVVDVNSTPPCFAILSHIWFSESPVSDQQVHSAYKREESLPVHEKVARAFDVAKDWGVEYLWVDSLCIDPSSTTELEECVNDASRRLRASTVCFVYLEDLAPGETAFDEKAWSRCKYWKDTWTLAELVLPSRVELFDQSWTHRGSKTEPELLSLLSGITRIPPSVLRDSSSLNNICHAVRVSWLSDRTSKREEDLAYSLVPIMGVSMDVRYGEGGERAFIRLQEEILKDTRDTSILAWKSDGSQSIRGLLACSPAEFRHFAHASETAELEPWVFNGRISFSSKGVRIHTHICNYETYSVLCIGGPKRKDAAFNNIGIYIRELDGVFLRINPGSEALMLTKGRRGKIDMARNVNLGKSIEISASWSQESDEHIAKTTELPLRLAQGDQNTGGTPSATVTAQKMTGVKRSRSGKALNMRSYFRDGLLHSLSDSDACTESEMTDTSQSDDYSLTDEDSGTEESTSGSTHVGNCSIIREDELREDKQKLLGFVYERVRAWVESAHYIEPPCDNIPQWKRARLSQGYSVPDYVRNKEKDDAEFVVPPRVDGYFNLACPFYVANPQRYRRCLLLHDLQTIRDVIRHLQKYHREPRYCPICQQTFANMTDYDNHMWIRTCKPQEPGPIDGLLEDQELKLVKQDRAYLSDEKRWFRIWSIVFPDAEPCESPYYKQGVERAVSVARDYWHRDGDKYVSQYFVTKIAPGTSINNPDEYRTVLWRALLPDLLEKVYEEHKTAE